jgi:hypothetical protein
MSDRFPFQFECVGCGAEVEVSREDAAEEAHESWTLMQTVEHVLVAVHHWWKTPAGRICGTCLDRQE